MVPTLHRHQVWTHPSDILDHFPICLEWISRDRAHNYSFKFNRACLLDQYFTQMVKRVWLVLKPSKYVDNMGLLPHNVRMLKGEVKTWIKQKSTKMEKDSLILDEDIISLLTSTPSGILT